MLPSLSPTTATKLVRREPQPQPPTRRTTFSCQGKPSIQFGVDCLLASSGQSFTSFAFTIRASALAVDGLRLFRSAGWPPLFEDYLAASGRIVKGDRGFVPAVFSGRNRWPGRCPRTFQAERGQLSTASARNASAGASPGPFDEASNRYHQVDPVIHANAAPQRRHRRRTPAAVEVTRPGHLPRKQTPHPVRSLSWPVDPSGVPARWRRWAPH